MPALLAVLLGGALLRVTTTRSPAVVPLVLAQAARQRARAAARPRSPARRTGHRSPCHRGCQEYDGPRGGGERARRGLPGCIKLAPDHIKDLFSRLEQAHWPKNPTRQVR
ncbi:hypothetical protein ACFV2Q_16005 [Streptomyces sp. NPDC059650]|uniref:hypothetical protein n=1 Tax=Streptomyces sp. NPDC059650 TaxID=3346896 RepID=UPI0036B7E20B